MRALLMTEPGDARRSRIGDVEVPRPGAGEVAIDVAYAGLNFMDVMARRGDPGYVRSWPYRPGLEVAGTVREVGADVVGLAVGDRVAAVPDGGGLAEVAIARAGLTMTVPAEVSLRTAAAVPLGLATAMLLLAEAGRFAPGDSVLVHSASGGIGSALAQLVPLLGGGRLIGTVGRAEKVEAARKSGYDEVFVRDEADAEAIRAANEGHGVDVILDPLGTSALDLDLDAAATGARIVLFGNASGGALDPMPPAGRLIGGNITVTGFSHRGLVAGAPRRVARAIRGTLDLLAGDRLDFPVTELSSLAEVPAAHDLLAAGRGAGKYVVRVTG
ncbi:quinone oxidoreductase family protein [Embleya hyalina]|uniref:NADPH:quinone reductase n=1 Tax=Embleya hyalina TaxID=516124 RepID=A0A401YHY6_9ACTN|nr:zinc-binding dehydrogenase [Embleya hyalina]GCD94210.1 NADPH:quinone reductase [Embleya hyalina]